MITQYLNRLAGSYTLLTANKRLAMYFGKQYDLEQHNVGSALAPSLDCLSWDAWIIRCYAQLNHPAMLLTEAQELTVWEQIITEALAAADVLLLKPWSIAQYVKEAWRLLQQFNVPLALVAAADAEDVQAFYGWAQQFQARCTAQQWLDASSCPRIIIEQLAQYASILPDHLILVGFEEFTPQMQDLLLALAPHCQWHIYPLPPDTEVEKDESAIPPSMVYQLPLLNEEEEITAMAHWAYAQRRQNPHGLIGCVIPQLLAKRDTVERIFLTAQQLDSPDCGVPIFNISSGKALHRYPLIRMATIILQLIEAPHVSMAQLSQLLCSPFIGGAEQELIQRSAFDITLRQTTEPYFSWEWILNASEQPSVQCPIWANHLSALLSFQPSIAVLKTCTYWADYFTQQLNAMGWPGERGLNSSEYQQVERWHALFIEFKSLDLVLEKPISQSMARQALLRLAERILFQPQTADSPIQILGMLEAVGISYARLWVMGLNDNAWPQVASPNPFIPLSVQRRFNMPHASAERELYFSRKLTARFSASAPTVVFSYSCQEGDWPLQPSTLVDHLPFAPADFFRNKSSDGLLIGTCQLEYVLDEMAPAVVKEESLRAGTAILKEQAACPFRAFAKIRLGATSWPASISGLNSQERGIYLHDVLAQIWEKLKTHDNLIRYDESALTHLVLVTVQRVLANKKKHRMFTLKPRFLKLESQRLLQLVLEWLSVEKQRPPFRVVGGESVHQLSFAGLALRLRIDREDELENGLRVIIDYKTGLPRMEDWFGERPDDPQMPLYCLSSEQPIAGLIFAQIRPNQCQFKGMTAEDVGIVGAKTVAAQSLTSGVKTWADFQAHQREVLLKIAEQFKAGHAKPDPKYAEQTCRKCDLQSLCRVQENGKLDERG